MKSQEDLKKRKIALDFLNACGADLEELPDEAWAIFKQIKDRHYIKPLLMIDKKAKMTLGQMSIKYGLKVQTIKNIIYL